MKKILFITALWTFLLSSCIKDEALNSEADILSFTLADSVVYAQASILNSDIILFLNENTDETEIKPIIEITPGAQLSPIAESYNLNETKTFQVTSQDGKYTKEYKIHIIREKTLSFSFEDWNDSQIGTRGYYPQLIDKQWASGNFGVWMANSMNSKGVKYPTKDTTDFVVGKRAALLVTQKGKTAFNKYIPIFSGSLFYGIFSLNTVETSKSVFFGQPFPESMGTPKRFTGSYKYKPGSVYTDEKGEAVDGASDECTVRAFLYKVSKGATTGAKGEEYLTGADNVLASDKVVAMADLKDTGLKEDFTRFNIRFQYKEALDFSVYDYRLAIVFASSKEGDAYKGAVGSTLIVDDIKVICEKE